MREKIMEILKKVVGEKIVCGVSIPEEGRFGHYSTNLPLRLAKERGEKALDLARNLADKISAAAPAGFFGKIEAAPPGFINFWLSPETIGTEFDSISKKNIKNFGQSSLGNKKTVIVEYSQPNIAKKMHVGHLRTTIIGDALANIYDMLGYKVIRWNYLGDWGTQFGKLIAAYKMWGDKKTVEKNPIEELQKLYVRFHDEMGNDVSLEEKGRAEFKKLEEGDGENKKLWKWFKEESLKEFEKIYDFLGVKFDTMIGESFFENEMKRLVADLLERGVARRSEGSIIIPLEKFGLPPALIQKSDGASLYLTRDIAALRYRIQKFKPEKILYVVGNEQALHFEQLFAVAKILGWDKTELVHVKYGLVLGEEGKRLATREGRAILLEDVLEKAVKLARETVEEKNMELTSREKDAVAKTVSVGALKYNDLRESRMSDIVFNWERMLDFHGDSAPYLQYAYARVRSIERKAGGGGRFDRLTAVGRFGKLIAGRFGKFTANKFDVKLLQKEIELAIIRKIIEFPYEISRSGEMLSTNNLAKYLYELASLLNNLYESTPVLKEPDAARRAALLALIDTVAAVLKKGLVLLGIAVVEEI